MKKSDMIDTNKVAKQYKDDFNLNVRKELHRKYSTNKQGFTNWLYSQYPFEHGMSVLELGSGNGDMWASYIYTLSKKINLYLSDFSEGMVEILTNSYKNYDINIQQIDIQSIPFDDNSFDIVIANMMLYHVPNLEKALEEVKRVLKPNGTFYAATFGENGLSQYLNQTLYDLNILETEKVEYNFTIQNGTDVLSKYFNHVSCEEYIDQLEITHIPDIVAYVKTMLFATEFTTKQEEKLTSYFASKTDKNGLLIIPKEYGTFISK